MITPIEIQEQCLKWWKEILISHVNGCSSFPREITRIGKVSSKDILNKLTAYKEGISLLKKNSKENKKHGYSLITEERIFNRIGTQTVPLKINIDTIDDYLAVAGKRNEYSVFCRNYELIINELPLLKDWVISNPIILIEHDTWIDTLKVCKYFLENPQPELYIRQLPIDIHTKYIEENRPTFKSLLTFLIPSNVDQAGETFEQMFHLKEKEKRIRIRFLDKRLSPLENFTDISFLLYELNQLKVNCDNVFVAENEMNFLTLPALPNTIAVWSGGGFQVSYLKDIHWLRDKLFFYWGDIDAHGFQILNQFRTYFANTIAVMMDEETLNKFKHTQGQRAAKQDLQKLSDSELKLYNHVRQYNLRLEQEKIDQKYSEERIKILLRDLI
jgi:hypothetical protein